MAERAGSDSDVKKDKVLKARLRELFRDGRSETSRRILAPRVE